MRCHICNSNLSPAEVQWNHDHQDWDPCGTCQEEIDAVFNDKSEEEIDDELALERTATIILGQNNDLEDTEDGVDSLY